MRSSRLLASAGLSAAESSPDDAPAGGGSGNVPVTVEHAFGETTIEPERVATVTWSRAGGSL
ncbi:hypothetical protein BHE97_09175 [Aeromicrobium sp. PE09-221]|uniref:hypothetical protein n=1 Tax=Aeromicrobium sp. PE09-221 TaxID=1898043 RepID=UPI0009C0FDA0|nr:hypothetical protein [Aeromicrobium sp. PE09-221]OUZ09969.1 hypothetical protein BHE97_09175 [Aeromicrobium sp. PE09-221]